MSEEVKEKKIGLFDFVNDLTYNKQYLLNEETEREFNIFMINRAIGNQKDLIFLANEMNKNPELSKEMIHDFYFNSVKAKKRYDKWAKANKDDKEVIDLLIRHYAVNRTVAQQYFKLMEAEDIENLKEMYFEGGRK